MTSLPLRAAVISASITSDSLPVRYTVCLIATTLGSAAASCSRSSTELKLSYGWCSSTSCWRITSNIEAPVANTFTGAGT
ncbi:hypothetical protein D3C72_2035500 [compost metagenome]